jgi:hypothetical protein
MRLRHSAFVPSCGKRNTDQFVGGTQADFNVAIINDLDSSFNDYFIVHVMKGDSVVSTTKYRYQVRPFEVSRTPVKVELPKTAGNYEVITELYGRKNNVVRSYRQIRMVQ